MRHDSKQSRKAHQCSFCLERGTHIASGCSFKKAFGKHLTEQPQLHAILSQLPLFDSARDASICDLVASETLYQESIRFVQLVALIEQVQAVDLRTVFVVKLFSTTDPLRPDFTGRLSWESIASWSTVGGHRKEALRHSSRLVFAKF